MATKFKYRGVWYANYYEAGKRFRKSLHTRNASEADEKLNQIAGDEYRGLMNIPIKATNVQLFQTEVKGVITEQGLIAEYLNHCKTRHAKNTYIRESNTLLKHFTEFFHEEKINSLGQITVSALEKYKTKRMNVTVNGTKAKVKHSTINRDIVIIKALVSYAVKMEKTNHNPLKGHNGKTKVEMLKVSDKKVRFLSDEETRKLIDAADERWKQIIVVTVNTGMRLGEVQNLRWTDIDFILKKIAVTNHEDHHTKSRKTRYLSMTPGCAAALASLKKGDGEYVFGAKNGTRPFTAHFGTIFNKLVQRAGITVVREESGRRDVSFHTLRHTFASHRAMKGIDMYTLKELMGHADIKTTMIYAHLSPEHKAEAINLVNFAVA